MALGMTQELMAKRMGYSFRTWQSREARQEARSFTQLSSGEFEILQLLKFAEPGHLVDLLVAVRQLYPRIKFLRDNPNNDENFNETFDCLTIALHQIEAYWAARQPDGKK